MSAPGYGHFTSLVPITLELAEAGIGVTIGVYDRWANEANWPHVRSVKLSSKGYPRPNDVPDWNVVRQRMAFEQWREAREVLLRTTPDAVVCDTSARGAQLAARELGIPTVLVCAPGDAPTAEFADRELIVLRDLWRTRHRSEGPPYSSAQILSVTYMPEEFYVGLPLRNDLVHARWWDSRNSAIETSDERNWDVYWSVGTTSPSVDMLRAEIEVVRDAGLDVCVAEPTADLAGALSGIDIVPFALARSAQRRSRVTVCHGGASSVREALAAGRPVAVTPFHSDQFFMAMRVEDLGLGVRVSESGGAATLRAIRRCLGSPEIQGNVKEFKGAFDRLVPMAELVRRIAE